MKIMRQLFKFTDNPSLLPYDAIRSRKMIQGHKLSDKSWDPQGVMKHRKFETLKVISSSDVNFPKGPGKPDKLTLPPSLDVLVPLYYMKSKPSKKGEAD